MSLERLKNDWKIIRENCIYIILSFFSLMILSLCFQDTINYDEFFSMQWCRWDWNTLLQRLINDVHPPLYYLILKPVLDITNGSMVCARLLSAIFGTMILWIGSLFIMHNFGKKAALFFACFIYLNPFMIQKATEIRMYMPASAFTVISGIMSYRILKESKRKDWIYFTISSLLAAYTHYYALLTMIFLYAGVGIYCIFTRNKRGICSWLLCALGTIVGYLPWLPIAIKQITTVNGGYWITMPSSRLAPLRELFYSKIPNTEHVYIGILVIFILMAFYALFRKKSVDAYWVLICSSALWGTLFFTILYATKVRPILVSRYLIMAVCLCVLGTSGMVRSLNKYVVILICLFCVLVGGIRYETAFRTQCNRNTTQTIAFVEENIAAADSIVYVSDNYGYFANCLAYYFPDVNRIGIEEAEINNLPDIVEDTKGAVWFFDVNQVVSGEDLVHMDSFGEFGFNSMTFEIYRLK